MIITVKLKYGGTVHNKSNFEVGAVRNPLHQVDAMLYVSIASRLYVEVAGVDRREDFQLLYNSYVQVLITVVVFIHFPHEVQLHV